jgi:cell division septal protein FtsQ
MDNRRKQIKTDYLTTVKKRKKAIKKDYQSRKFDNPFFNRRAKREQIISNRLKLGLIIFGVSIIALFYLFFYSPFFIIKNVEIKGLTRINSNDITNLVFSQSGEWRWFIFKQNNLFTFSIKDLETKIQNNYNFAEVKATKKIPNTILISINERSCALILENPDSSCYFIDPEGYLIKELGVQTADRNKLPVVSDERGLTSDGSKIDLDRQYLDFMLELYQKITASTDLKIDKFIIDKNPDTLRVNLKEGPFLLFSIKEPQEKQLNKLIVLRKEKLKETFNTIKYFDLRFGDKVYYVNNEEAGK